MPIGNIGNKVSSADRERLGKIRNPPEFRDGFSEEDGDTDLFMDDDGDDDFFSDDDLSDFNESLSSTRDSGSSSFGGSSSFSGFGGESSGFGGFGSTGFGDTRQHSASGFNKDSQGQGNGSAFDSALDSVIDKTIETCKTGAPRTTKIIAQLFKSTFTRTADDWGYYGKRLIDSSSLLGIIGIALWIVFGLLLHFNKFRFAGIPLNMIMTTIVCYSVGFIFIGFATLRIDKLNKNGRINDINNLPEIGFSEIEKKEPAYESDADELLNEYDSLFGDDEDSDDFDDDDFGDAFGDEFEGYESDDMVDSFNGNETSDSTDSDTEFINNKVEDDIDFSKVVDSAIANVAIINRPAVLDAIRGLFVTNTPGFADRKEISPDSDDFINIESLVIEALASASKGNAEELAKTCKMHSCYDTYFTYEIRVDRIRGLNKLEDIEREMVAYFRSSVKDDSVTCSVDLDGKMYSIQISKGVSAVVTYGDLFSLKEVRDFFYDTGNKIPMIAGISDSGEPILIDAKTYDTMLIAGKPRSGKSWYVLNIMLNMMFNSPEDIQFIVIDPKESNLFKTLSLMPHVCGLHNDDNILRILRDLIDKEGARRKKLLSDNRCENVWDLKKKGINLPILYIVIDELMTVIANLGANDKEFKDLMRVIVTQLPSQGIRLIMVPHRSTGVVEKSIRSNISFTAAIRAEPEIIKETLDIKSFDKPLINPGDTALKMQGFAKEMFVHGPAVTDSDVDNTKFIEAMARIFYKMGVELPDMESIGCGYNRDMEYIKDELQLSTDSTRVQFDINDIENIKWETEDREE